MNMNISLQGSRKVSSFRTLSIHARSNFAKLLESDKFCDVTFVVGEEKKEYPVVRAMFAIHSNVLESMLYGNMLESTLGRIELMDITPSTFEFLRLFCYGLDPELNAKNVVGILQCADKYLIEPLKGACIEFISSISISRDGNSSDFLSLMIELNKYNLSDKILDIIDSVKRRVTRCDDQKLGDDGDDFEEHHYLDFEEILNNPLLMKLNKSGFENFVLKSRIFDDTKYVSKGICGPLHHDLTPFDCNI